MEDTREIENFENEGGMIYPSSSDIAALQMITDIIGMEPYSPPWACPQWGQYEHDWLDCVECQANYEIYLEEHEKDT